MDKKLVNCPRCDMTWPYLSEQAAAITLVGYCIVCMVKQETGGTEIGPGTLRQWLDKDGIIAEANLRQTEAGYRIEPCPRCIRVRDDKCKICEGLGSVYINVEHERKEIEQERNGRGDQ